MGMRVALHAHVEAQGQPWAVCSLRPTFSGFRGLNSGGQAFVTSPFTHGAISLALSQLLVLRNLTPFCKRFSPQLLRPLFDPTQSLTKRFTTMFF